MKNVLTKITYMVIGSILTLIGYHFGNVDNNSVDAQGTSNEIVNKIRVRQIEIVDSENQPSIYLGTDLDKGQIKFVGDNDTSQISLKATSQGGQIKLHNKSGKQKIHLGLSDDRGIIKILGENEKGRVVLKEGDDDGGFVTVFSEDGKSIVSLIAEHSPMVIVGKDEKVVVSLGVGVGDFPMVMVQDPSGGLALLYAKDGSGFVNVLGKEGITYASLSSDSDGGILNLNDKSGKRLIHAGGTDEGDGFLVTLNKDGTITNSVGTKSTTTYKYKEEVKRTRSLDPPIRRK